MNQMTGQIIMVIEMASRQLNVIRWGTNDSGFASTWDDHDPRLDIATELTIDFADENGNKYKSSCALPSVASRFILVWYCPRYDRDKKNGNAFGSTSHELRTPWPVWNLSEALDDGALSEPNQILYHVLTNETNCMMHGSDPLICQSISNRLDIDGPSIPLSSLF